jgi:ECF transporter S component (folate family)
MQKWNTKKLVILGFLTALSIVLTRLLVIYLTESIRISFGNIPIMLAGLWFGPFAGAAVGFAADFVGASLFSGLGWYAPMSLTPVLFGLISGLLKPLILKNYKPLKIWGMTFLCNLFGSMGWTTWCLAGMYGTPFFALLSARVPLYLAIGVLEALVIHLILKSPVYTVVKGSLEV